MEVHTQNEQDKNKRDELQYEKYARKKKREGTETGKTYRSRWLGEEQRADINENKNEYVEHKKIGMKEARKKDWEGKRWGLEENRKSNNKREKKRMMKQPRW